MPLTEQQILDAFDAEPIVRTYPAADASGYDGGWCAVPAGKGAAQDHHETHGPTPEEAIKNYLKKYAPNKKP